MSEEKSTNAAGEKLLNKIREIADEAGKADTPQKAARLTAFSILVLLDGSGESLHDELYKVFTSEDKPVKFFHHDL